MNEIGIKTTHSCQGDNIHSAYITIDMNKGVYFSHDIKTNKLTIRWKKNTNYIPRSSIITTKRRTVFIKDLDDA